MFLEIEQKVSKLSGLGQVAGQVTGQQQQQAELGAVGSQQEAAELLSSKLELLKANLISFQQLLQERQGEERMSTQKEKQEKVMSFDSTRGRCASLVHWVNNMMKTEMMIKILSFV